MVSRVSWVSQQKPILVVASLSIERYNTQIELLQVEGVETILPIHVARLQTDPVLPGCGQTVIQEVLSFALEVIHIYWSALMVATRWNHSSLELTLQKVSQDHTVVEVVVLRLLPDVMSGVVASPKNQVDWHFGHLIQK